MFADGGGGDGDGSQTHHGDFSFLLLHAEDAGGDLDGEESLREISG